MKELETSGPARACPMLEEVVAIAPDSVGAWILLGECRKRQGRLASAHRAYSQAAVVARRVGLPGRSEKAAQLAAALEPKLARLALSLPKGTRSWAELSVQVDGLTIAPDALKTALPVDRGDHVIEVRAEGKQPLHIKRRVEFDGVVISVSVEALRPLAPGARATSPQPGASLGVASREDPGGPAGSAASLEPLPPARRWQGWRMKVGVAVGAAGVAGLVAGSVAGAVAMARRDESNDGHCQENTCDSAGIELRDASLGAGNLSTGLFVAGAVLAAAGVALVLVPVRTSAATARVVIGPGQIGVRGAF